MRDLSVDVVLSVALYLLSVCNTECDWFDLAMCVLLNESPTILACVPYIMLYNSP